MHWKINVMRDGVSRAGGGWGDAGGGMGLGKQWGQHPAVHLSCTDGAIPAWFCSLLAS